MQKLNRFQIAALILFFTIGNRAFAQIDPQFTSNMFNLLSTNPAKAGSTGQMNAFGLVRTQWVDYGSSTTYSNSNTNPATQVFSLDANVKILNKESGLGASIIRDNLGLVNNLSINFIYSYRKKLWNGTLGIGISPGIVRTDWLGEEIYIPESEGFEETQHIIDLKGDIETLQLGTTYDDSKFDMNLGAFFENDKYYIGLSATHLFRPELEVSEQGVYLFFNRTYFLSAGYRYQLENNTKLVLTPSLFFKSDGITQQTDLNCNVWYNKKYYGGITYRLEDGFAFLLGLKMKSGLMVGYAIDLTTSRLKYGTYGSNEVFLSYVFDLSANKQKSKHKSIRIL